jgi:hypothetical protein
MLSTIPAGHVDRRLEHGAATDAVLDAREVAYVQRGTARGERHHLDIELPQLEEERPFELVGEVAEDGVVDLGEVVEDELRLRLLADRLGDPAIAAICSAANPAFPEPVAVALNFESSLCVEMKTTTTSGRNP